jgi:hypothetical protein
MVSSLASAGSVNEDGVDNGEGEDDAVARRQGMTGSGMLGSPDRSSARLDARTRPFFIFIWINTGGGVYNRLCKSRLT